MAEPFPAAPARTADVRLRNLRLPGGLRASLAAFLAAEQEFKASRQRFPVQLAFELAQDIARDIGILAHSLAGHPRSAEMLEVLHHLLAAMQALADSYAAPPGRHARPSARPSNLKEVQ